LPIEFPGIHVSKQIVMRPAEPQDFPAWKMLWDGYNAFYGRKDQTALPAEVTQTTWSRFFEASEPMHALVAERGGELLGLAHYLYHRSTNQLGLNCYLQDLFTADAARGTGIGRALIDEVCVQAQRAGSRRVYWQTHETNLTAMKLYDKVAVKSGFLVYTRPLP
jgi:GNAT superfamily N-acetyltransferase